MLRLDAIQAAVSVYDRERFWKRRPCFPRDASSSLQSDVSSFVRDFIYPNLRKKYGIGRAGLA